MDAYKLMKELRVNSEQEAHYRPRETGLRLIESTKEVSTFLGWRNGPLTHIDPMIYLTIPRCSGGEVAWEILQTHWEALFIVDLYLLLI